MADEFRNVNELPAEDVERLMELLSRVSYEGFDTLLMHSPRKKQFYVAYLVALKLEPELARIGIN